jgi:Stress up-regulated Nod 19
VRVHRLAHIREGGKLTARRGKKTFNAAEGPQTTGYYIGAKDNIMLAAEIINTGPVTKEVYVVLDFDYVQGAPPVTATWHVLGVGTCDGQGIAIRPEAGKAKFSVKSQPMTVLRTGYIFGLRTFPSPSLQFSKRVLGHREKHERADEGTGGHVHDGGVGVTMTRNGSLICDSKATYGGKNEVAGDWATISDMAGCAERVPIPVRKGDVIAVEAAYDFDAHPA